MGETGAGADCRSHQAGRAVRLSRMQPTLPDSSRLICRDIPTCKPIHGRMKTISVIAHKACLLWAVWLTASDSASALDPTRDRILYAVGYGHLDDQWNWTIQ